MPQRAMRARASTPRGKSTPWYWFRGLRRRAKADFPPFLNRWDGYQIVLLQNRRLLQSSSSVVLGCLNGEFKASRGAGLCAKCPSGASTVSPWNAISSYDACACLPGYKAVRDENGRLASCVACPQNTYSNYPTANDTVCTPCPPSTEALSIGSSYCMCASGTYRSADATRCIQCANSSYCQLETMFKCPDHSFTPPGVVGKSRGDCVCEPGFYGLLSDWSQTCQPLPVGASCPAQTGMLVGSCQCSSGWDSEWRAEGGTFVLHCVPSPSDCGAGNYIHITHASDAISADTCVRCPVNTYAASQAAMYDPNRPLSQQCTACPYNFFTTSTGSSSIADCVCSQHILAATSNTTIVCGGCPKNTIYNVFTQQCSSCPNGMLPIDSSMCGCAAGSQVAASGDRCEPCPLNYYSREVSISCSPCAQGRITKSAGSVSCLCGNGLLPRAGIC